MSPCVSPVSSGGYKVPALLVAPPGSMVGMEALEPEEFHPQPPPGSSRVFGEPNPANPTLPRAEGAARSSWRCLSGRQGPAPSSPFGKGQTRNSAPSAPGNGSQDVKPGVGLGGSPPHPRRGSKGSPRNPRSIPTFLSLPSLQAPSSSGFFPPFTPFSSSLFPWLS